jgi:RNase P subunit RPR2
MLLPAKFLKDFFQHCWDYFFSYKTHKINCVGCKNPLVIKARSPRIGDSGKVFEHKCEQCGSITDIAYYVNVATGYGFTRKKK